MTVLSLIAAMDENRLIGRKGALPWRLPADLQHFKTLTLGKTVLMGRKTWDSLGRPLPQRDNWVLTRDRSFAPIGARVFHALEQALAAAPATELMVIGGGELYAQTLPLAQRLYLTRVATRVEDGDAWFPAWDAAAWRLSAESVQAADERHAWPYRFQTWERV